MPRTKKKNTQELKKQRMEILAKLPEPNDTMVEVGDSKFKMEVGESLYGILQLRNIGLEKPKSDEEMIDRLEKFFAKCSETGQIPTIEKACVSLGITTNELRKIRDGVKEGFSFHTKDIIKELYTICSAVAGDLAMKGKVNPVVYIFTAKNYFDMSDRNDIVITPNNTIEPTTTVEAINAKYDELPKDE